MTANRATAVLLNLGHAIDHLFLLIFATAVGAIATDFGYSRWEDLMPYGAGAFLMFGLGSLPAGRLGDQWGRRAMIVIFFIGLGVSALVVAATRNAWQMAVALSVMGAFSAIYHPVGIPMLVQGVRRPGATIGISGLAGNLGIAVAAVLTGFLVSAGGWRLAFIVPGIAAILLGLVFLKVAPAEDGPPARRGGHRLAVPKALLARVFFVVTGTAITGSLLFNFTTNGNGELLRERLTGIVNDPASLGLLLAGVYVVGALSQVVVGRLIDRFPIKRVFVLILAAQAPMFLLAAHAEGWMFYLLAVGYMVSVFAAIPFTDALIVRYVDDSMRSRVAGVRLAVSFGVSSAAVWLLGPLVKANGFDMLLLLMAGIAVLSLAFAAFLPQSGHAPAQAQPA